MDGRAKSLMLFTALAALAVDSAAAQVRPAAAQAPPAARPQPVQPAAPGAPLPGSPNAAAQAQPTEPPPPPPLPPAVWDAVSAQDLLYYIQQIGAEGLNPNDYDPAGLAAAIQSGDPMLMSKEATERFNRV